MENNNFFGRRGRYQENYNYRSGNRRFSYRGGGMSPLVSIGLMILVGYVIFKVATGLLGMLSALAPFLLIASLIINRRVFEEYFGFIKNLFDKNVIIGLVATALSVTIFLPIVAGILFYRALTTRGNKVSKKGDDFLPYEEVSSRLDNTETEEELDDDFLDLPPLESLSRETTSSRKL